MKGFLLAGKRIRGSDIFHFENFTIKKQVLQINLGLKWQLLNILQFTLNSFMNQIKLQVPNPPDSDIFKMWSTILDKMDNDILN